MTAAAPGADPAHSGCHGSAVAPGTGPEAVPARSGRLVPVVESVRPGLPGAGVVPGVDLPRLARLLGGPDTAWLVERVRRRLEREESLTASVSLTGPSPAQRAAAERLLGRPPGAGRSLTVPLAAVDAVLRRSGISPHGLADAVLALTGPVTPRREVADREAESWRRAYAPLEALPVAFADWAASLRTAGTARRLARTPEATAALLTRAATVLTTLPLPAPYSPPTSLASFAARIVDDAHALDDGTALATIVLSAIRAVNGLPDGSGAQWRREAWASAGLLRDDLSSTVLVLNLRGTPPLDWHADLGEPAVLTLRQLASRPPAAASVPAHVRICENPAVLAAAADAHGPHCPTLICLQGQPSAAALTLLRHLHAQGATLHYHGDFDWGGLRIAAHLLRHVPWRPWRFAAADYRAAATRRPGAPLLTGTPADAPWDPELRRALEAVGLRVEEESVGADLLADLGQPGRA
ncbi:TIGR02679 family protein [Streptomyces sp. NPDC087440]|uniref:TIGR02679 family protein n=1 Tax=Streptomyces sp. NPDC087440 TaxID=3365790 RepID=UPI003806986F